MKNFYNELKLNPSASLPELQSELIRQEQLWHRREVNSPETATARLALINEAKKVFASPSSKAAYDRELANGRRKPATADPNAERHAQWKKWYDSALQHMEEGHYDLAKTSIERALSYFDNESVDSQFYNIVATIFRENQDYYGSLSYINRAIVADPENPSLYLTKGITLTAYLESKEQIRDRTATVKSEVDAYMLAIRKSDAINDTDTLAIADSMFAYSFIRATRQIPMSEYIKNRTIENENSARKYAELAVKLGDPWNIGKSVLDTLSRIETEYNRLQDEQRHAFATKYRTKKQQDDFVKWQKEQEESYYQTINNFKQETGITEIYTPVALNTAEWAAAQDAVSLIEEDKWLKPRFRINAEDISLRNGKSSSFDYELFLDSPGNNYRVRLLDSVNPLDIICKLPIKAVPLPKKKLTKDMVLREKEIAAKEYANVLKGIKNYLLDNQWFITYQYSFLFDDYWTYVSIILCKTGELYMKYDYNHSKMYDTGFKQQTIELEKFHRGFDEIMMEMISRANNMQDIRTFTVASKAMEDEAINSLNVQIWKKGGRCLKCGGPYIWIRNDYRCMRCFSRKNYYNNSL